MNGPIFSSNHKSAPLFEIFTFIEFILFPFIDFVLYSFGAISHAFILNLQEYYFFLINF